LKILFVAKKEFLKSSDFMIVPIQLVNKNKSKFFLKKFFRETVFLGQHNFLIGPTILLKLAKLVQKYIVSSEK